MTNYSLLERSHSIQSQLVHWRRTFHQNPELGFEEKSTANTIATALTEMGIEVQTGVGKTGVIGYIGEGSPVVGIRADMDALPINEKNDVVYRSQTPNVMHACGHDAHCAMLLGVARVLSDLNKRPTGQIRLIFQPSEESADEENKSGAVRMIEDGGLDGVDYLLALHVDSTMPAGKVEINEGHITAAEDSFHIVIEGTGGHGAMPHQTVDPTFLLAQGINAIQGIRSRRLDPVKAATISVGYIHSGTTTNVIPQSVRMGGTMRSFDPSIRAQMQAEMDSALGVIPALGGSYTLRFVPGYPSTYNDPRVASTIRDVVRSQLGDSALLSPEPMMAAEDFSYMVEKAPGAMFMLGAKLDSVHRPHHTPIFDISEDVLPIGTSILAEAALRLLRSTPEQE